MFLDGWIRQSHSVMALSLDEEGANFTFVFKGAGADRTDCRCDILQVALVLVYIESGGPCCRLESDRRKDQPAHDDRAEQASLQEFIADGTTGKNYR